MYKLGGPPPLGPPPGSHDLYTDFGLASQAGTANPEINVCPRHMHSAGVGYLGNVASLAKQEFEGPFKREALMILRRPHL